MDYDALYNGAMIKDNLLHQKQEDERIQREILQRPPLVLPKTKDVREMAEIGIEVLLPQLIQDAYVSDNIPQKLSVLKECLDRRYGKAEQSVTAKVEMVKPKKSMQEVAAMIAMSLQEAKRDGITIDGTSVVIPTDPLDISSATDVDDINVVDIPIDPIDSIEEEII